MYSTLVVDDVVPHYFWLPQDTGPPFICTTKPDLDFLSVRLATNSTYTYTSSRLTVALLW